MTLDIKTHEDYNKAIIGISKTKAGFARLLHYFNPKGKYETIYDDIQRKTVGKISLTNSDITIINLIYELKKHNALPNLKEIKK